MLEKIAKYIPFTTIIIIYLFFCGGLHLIAFWSTFGIDISNFVSIWEIPKSFIYPFVLTQGVGILLSLIQIHSIPKEIANKKTFIPNKTAYIILSDIDTYMLLCLVLIPLIFVFKTSEAAWVLIGTFVGFILSLKLASLNLSKAVLPYALWRYFICTVLVMTPTFCVVVGKVNSLDIYNNNKTTTIHISNKSSSNIVNDSLDLKLLGFLGDKLIVSSLDNEKVLVFNQNEVGEVQISRK